MVLSLLKFHFFNKWCGTQSTLRLGPTFIIENVTIMQYSNFQISSLVQSYGTRQVTHVCKKKKKKPLPSEILLNITRRFTYFSFSAILLSRWSTLKLVSWNVKAISKLAKHKPQWLICIWSRLEVCDSVPVSVLSLNWVTVIYVSFHKWDESRVKAPADKALIMRLTIWKLRRRFRQTLSLSAGPSLV